MRMKRILAVLFVMMMVAGFAGCGKSENVDLTEVVSKPTEKVTEAATEATTEAATEAATKAPATQAPATATPATEAPAEQHSGEYTGIELADMNMKDIIAIMGEYDSVYDEISPAFSSQPIDYYYNSSVLPGFYFTHCKGTNGDFDTDEFSIAIIDGAKLNDRISSDMTYNELAAVTGDFEVRAVVASFTGFATVDGHSVIFIFARSSELEQHTDNEGYVSSDDLKSINPTLHSIGLHSYM